MTTKQQFNSLYPNRFFLEESVSPALRQLLIANGWISPSETILAVEKPGEGNMNAVVRVRTNSQTLILKQPRPWVQKYPQVPAPMERVVTESQFYEWIARDTILTRFVPNLIGFDADNWVLALEDLGAGTDFMFLYQPGHTLDKTDLEQLIQFLSRLHTIRVGNGRSDFPDNRAMRLLNNEHIFHFPFRQNTGFDLDGIQMGLQSLSLPYRDNTVLKQKSIQLGEVYLLPGPSLIHGDYYPGSWLRFASGARIIDPEFSFFGRPEFDVGIMLAHLKLAQQGNYIQKTILEQYKMPVDFDTSLMYAFTGVEMIRRLIGLAQLPVGLDLAQKKVLLDEATVLVLENG